MPYNIKLKNFYLKRTCGGPSSFLGGIPLTKNHLDAKRYTRKPDAVDALQWILVYLLEIEYNYRDSLKEVRYLLTKELKNFDLEKHKKNWYSKQTIQAVWVKVD